MRRIVMVIVVLTLLLGISSACSEPVTELVEVTVVVEPTAMPAPAEIPPLSFVGVWFSEDHDSMLVITEEYLYIHEFSPRREVYSRIDGYDLEAETIELFMTAILSGGMSMGYDSPQLEISYHINGTVMEFWGQRLDYAPDDEGPVIYIYDEFLNGK